MKPKQNRLVVGDASWADMIPKWLLDEIGNERMLMGLVGIMKSDLAPSDRVGDAEMCAYLMTASMRAPMPYQYTEIYVWLTARVMERTGKELPDFLEAKLKRGLTQDEERELRELRSQIYRSRGGEISHPLLDVLREMKRHPQKMLEESQGEEFEYAEAAEPEAPPAAAPVPSPAPVPVQEPSKTVDGFIQMGLF